MYITINVADELIASTLEGAKPAWAIDFRWINRKAFEFAVTDRNDLKVEHIVYRAAVNAAVSKLVREYAAWFIALLDENTDEIAATMLLELAVFGEFKYTEPE